MKKLILSVSLVLIAFNGYAQTGSMNSSPGAYDSSNNPSGVGFGGALGGANTPSGSLATPGPGPGSSTGTSTIPGSAIPQEQQESVPRGNTFEEQQERGNFPGGSQSGQPSNSTVAPTNPSAIPTDTAAPPTRPSTTPSPTGIGTGSPTSF